MLKLINRQYVPHAVKIGTPDLCYVYLWKMRSLSPNEAIAIDDINRQSGQDKTDSFRKYIDTVKESKGFSYQEAIAYIQTGVNHLLVGEEDEKNEELNEEGKIQLDPKSAVLLLNSEFPDATQELMREQGHYSSVAYQNTLVASTILEARYLTDIELSQQVKKNSTELLITPLKVGLKKGSVFSFNGTQVTIEEDATEDACRLVVSKVPKNMTTGSIGFLWDWELEKPVIGKPGGFPITELMADGLSNFIDAVCQFYLRENAALPEPSEMIPEEREAREEANDPEGKPEDKDTSTISSKSINTSQPPPSTGKRSIVDSNTMESQTNALPSEKVSSASLPV